MFSFILCTLGRRVELARLLASITSGCRAAKELIIINQSDQDLSFCLAFQDDVTEVKLFKTEKGLSRGRNVGLAEAKYPIVAFPDDDCWYGESTLSDVAQMFNSHPECDALCINGKSPDGKNLMRAAMSKKTFLKKSNVFKGPTSISLFVKRRALLEWDIRFDENIGAGCATEIQAGEESDLLLRMLEHGARMLWIPEITVFHPEFSAKTVSERNRHAWRYGYASGYLLQRHRFGPFVRLKAVIVPAAGAGVALLSLDKDRALVRLSRLKGILQGLTSRNATRPRQARQDATS
jgi:glycosyltransferase involved in cell wall biosynthesis